MDLKTLSAVPGSEPQPLGRRQLTATDALYLRFAVGDLAEAVALDPAGTVLRAHFLPVEQNVRAVAQVRALGDAVLVEMESPRQIFSIALDPARFSKVGYLLAVHRVDGNAVAVEPTATGMSLWAIAALAAFFGGPHSGPKGPLQPASTFLFLDFTDARFAVRLRDAQGAPVPLDSDDVVSVYVRSFPTGARLGLAAPDRLDEPAFFWQVPGEIGHGVPLEAGVADVGPALAAALDLHLSRLPLPLPAAVDVALVIASDAPCLFDLEAVRVPYRLVRRSLPGGAEKEVLRFPAGSVSERQLALRLPGGTTVTAAVLETAPSFRDDRPAAGDPAGTAPAEPGESQGLRVDGASWVAQGLALAEAVSLGGLALGVLTLAAGTELRVEIQEDFQGRPSGRALAAGTLALAEAGRRLWASLFWPSPVVLSTQPCWLLATATRGAAVWLTRPGPGGVRILDLRDPAAPGKAFAGRETLHRLLASAGQGQGAAPAVALRLGDAAVPASGAAGDRQVYDLTDALNGYLASHPGAASLDVPLTFTAAVPGILTVYPPRIEYEPA
jgi:hypothetical protein